MVTSQCHLSELASFTPEMAEQINSSTATRWNIGGGSPGTVSIPTNPTPSRAPTPMLVTEVAALDAQLKGVLDVTEKLKHVAETKIEELEQRSARSIPMI